MDAGRGRLLSTLGLAAAVTVVWWLRLVHPGRAIDFANSDLLLYFYPLYDTAYRWLAQGVLPSWNPYQLCGIPWLATLQGGFFYPGHVLYLLLPTHLAMAASSVLHLVLVAVSMAALARRLGLGGAAATLAGLLVIVRGALPQLVLVPTYIEAAAWLPLGAAGVHGLVAGEGRRALLALAGATAASWLAGCPQVTVYLLYAWGLLFLALLAAARPGAARAAGAATNLAAAVVLGTLIAAVQLLPTYELMTVGTRTAAPHTLSTMWPLGDERRLLPQLLAGSSASFGVVGLSLVAAALVAGRHRALVVWSVVLGGLALTFSLGTLTPLFRLYRMLPLVSWFRVPSRMLFLADFCWALLVAVGLDALARPPAAGRRRLVAAVTIVAAAAFTIVASRRGANTAAVLGVAAALGAVLVWRGRAWAAAAVAVLGVMEALVAPPTGLLLPYDAESAMRYRRHEDALRLLAARADGDRVWFFVDRVNTIDLAPRLATRYGIRSIGDYEPLNLRRQAEYFTFLVEGALMVGRVPFYGWLRALAPRWGGESAATRRRLLDLAAVRFAVLPRGAAARPGVAAFLRDAGLVARPFPDPELLLFENPNALPRAFTVHRVFSAPLPYQLLPLLADPGFDPLVASYSEADPGLEPAAAAPRGAPATIVRDEPQLVEVEATLAAPGLVVLADSFYPGWQATVDGLSAPILAVNHLFRGVAATAGRHRVRFEYRPASLRWGAAVSAIGIVLACAVALTARRI